MRIRGSALAVLLFALSPALALATRAAAQQPDWIPHRSLPGHIQGVMTYDSVRERVVLFGDNRERAGQTGTWEWDGTQWSKQSPSDAPRRRIDAAMVFDHDRGVAVFFGGSGTGGVRNETWEWDGLDWHQRTPANAPSARSGHAMTYDSVRRQVILFGGTDSVLQPHNDTWAWDGINWTQLSPTNSPTARTLSAMTFDSARGRAVLFGGRQGSSNLGDTWEWDGANWTPLSPPVSPGARSAHAMAFDASLNAVVLTGGTCCSAVITETWLFSGGTWLRLQLPTNPPVTFSHGMAFDAARRRIVLFGAGTLFNETWLLDSSGWSLASSDGVPVLRDDRSVAYDAARGETVMFGGSAPRAVGVVSYDETWTFRGSRWVLHDPPTKPAGRRQSALAFDPVRQLTVMFAGDTGSTQPNITADTWEWNGTDWTSVAALQSPPARHHHAMAFDGSRVLAFGGLDAAGAALGDTWTWDGIVWAQRAPTTTPPSRSRHALAFDSSRQRLVMFGGAGAGGALGDTWEWDQTNWVLRTPATSPSPRAGHTMAFDTDLQRVVLQGGDGLTDAWQWDGSNWQRHGVVSPAQGSDPEMAYDSAMQRIVWTGRRVPSLFPLPYFETYVMGTPARSDAVGSGCAGTAGVPALHSSAPYLENPGFSIHLVGARPAAPATIALAFFGQSVPLGGGCSLHLSGQLFTWPVTTSAAGAAQMTLAIPASPELRGLPLYAQGIVVDPAGPFFGLALTGARRHTVGD